MKGVRRRAIALTAVLGPTTIPEAERAGKTRGTRAADVLIPSMP